MKINIISSLNSPDQVGGAALRCLAIERVYNMLGLTTQTWYQDQIIKKNGLSSFVKSIPFGHQTRIFFQRANIGLPPAHFLHLDNLRQFNWNIHCDGKPKIIYNAHNLEFENYYDRKDNFFSRGFRQFEAKKIESADLIFVCSEREKNILCTIHPPLRSKIFILPNLLNRMDYNPDLPKNLISFVGTLNYYPNILAVNYLCDYFIKKLPPEIKKTHRFVIAGRSPLPQMKEKAINAGFEFYSDLSAQEIKDIFAHTLITLAPITSGSGTRIKIVEAIFSGCHVLSTPLGAEGISSKLITYSDLENFPQTFCSLINTRSKIDVQNELQSFSHQYDLATWFQDNKRELHARMELPR